MIAKYVIYSLHLNHVAVVLVFASKSDYTTRKANGIFQWASVASCKNQNSSYHGKF